MKYKLLGFLFVAILLFGCVQQEVKTPGVVDDEEINVPEEDETYLVEENDEESDSISELNDDEIVDELISQRCVYNDGTSEVIYLIKGNKIKMSSSNQGSVVELIIDVETSIIYDKGGMMLMGMSDLSNCDWVTYEMNIIQNRLENEKIITEDENMMDGIVTMDDNFICTNVAVSNNEFETNGKVCDGTNDYIDMIIFFKEFKEKYN